MEYFLEDYNHRYNHTPSIVIVGVGGTGGFLAESLCRLMTGLQTDITLIDHDVIEPHNLLRQNFQRHDIGKYKSETLAIRLADTFNRPISYLTTRYDPKMNRNNNRDHADIIIGCVDNAEARQSIADSIVPQFSAIYRPWIIDVGNGKNWGQVLIGNTNDPSEIQKAFNGNICRMLPLPTWQLPDLLTYVPDDPPDIDCAAAMDLTDQDPTINQMMASLTTQVVRRIFDGTCPFMALHVDMDSGHLHPTYATPQSVSNVTGIPVDDIKHDNRQDDPPKGNDPWI